MRSASKPRALWGLARMGTMTAATRSAATVTRLATAATDPLPSPLSIVKVLSEELFHSP